MRLFYDIATTTMKVLLIALTRWRVEGKENVPRTGPLIIVANHHNIIDPPLLSASVPRRISFMAKEELFRSTMVRAIVQGYGAFRVRRGQLDRVALRQALAELQNGGVLGMFPEGQRSPNAQLQSPQPGTSLLAAHSGAPLLPVAISGSERVKGSGFILHRPQITVTIGRPIILPSAEGKLTRSRLAKYSDSIMERIAELLPESYRGIYDLRGSLRSGNGD